MKCPSCEIPMHWEQYSDLDCYSCLHGCGLWLHKKSKWNFADKHEGVKIHTTWNKECPECSEDLQPLKVKLKGDNLHIEPDVCPSCQGIFINCIDFKTLQRNRTQQRKRRKKHKTGLHWNRKETATDKYYKKYRQDRHLEMQDYAFSFLIGLPIEINLPPQKIPVVTLILFAANVLLFLLLSQSSILSLALVPSRFDITTFFTSIFMHGSWLHLLGNMYFLYILGDNVEDRLGRTKYTIFYFLCGAIANLTYLFINSGSSIPVVGASGAISGIMGGYLIACRKAQFGIMLFFVMIKVPAIAYFAFWIFIQFMLGTMHANVAWEEHLGGFFAGLILYPILKNISQRT